MNIKKDFYKQNKETFESKIKMIKEDENTLKFFNNTKTPYFYFPTVEINNKILEINKLTWKFDLLFKSLSVFGQNQILQSYLIKEIKSTNEIENIYSTHHDIFYILKNEKINKKSKILSITRRYITLLLNGSKEYKTHQDIREIYDYLFKDILKSNDIPDGEFYRKDHVYISDGINKVHEGFYPESIINETMNEYLKLYNSNTEAYIKGIIGHFMIETIHPFYDGNGRLGRFLFSNQLLKDTNSYSSLFVANAFNSSKNKYYKAFREGRDIHQFGCIDEYVEIILDILIENISNEIKNLNLYLEKINKDENINFNKNEKKIYGLLKEATYLSNYGVSNNELIEFSHLSRRTIVTIINKFRTKNLLLDTQIGKTKYHKLNKE